MFLKSLFRIPLLCLLMLTSNSMYSQTYSEEKEDAYLPMLQSQKKTSKPYQYKSAFISTTQVNTDLNGNDILNDAANEPSFAMDINDAHRMLIGWRQFDNIESNFRQAGISYSLDKGSNWIYMDPIEKGLFRSDPVLSTDIDGNFYYNSLKEGYICDVFKSYTMDDWSDKTYAIGGDKQWMVIDKTPNPSQGNIYAFWKSSFSDCPGGNFTRSFNGGASYEDCSLTSENITRGTLSVGPEGELYACGGLSGTHVVLKSETAKNPQSNVIWETKATVDLLGRQALYDGPNPAGMLGQVWVATDHSFTDSRGNVYLLSSTKRSDNNDLADIMFSKSIDGGNTWSEAIKINADASTQNWQWFGTMSVAPNGRIDVVWLDTRDNPGTFLSTLYYSSSEDAGDTWSENMAMSEAFDPHLGFPNQNKMGDYYHMISTNEGAHLAWAATFNGGQDIYYSYIPANPDVTATSELETDKKFNSFVISPNPNDGNFLLEIDAIENQNISFRVFDMLGNQVINKEEIFINNGLNKIEFKRENRYKIISGMYAIHAYDQEGRLLFHHRLFLREN